MSKICIYHGNCADGFTAAWAVRKAFAGEDIEFHPGVYGAPPPDVKGKEVIIVDFSYPRETLYNMLPGSRGILVLDHHKSAEADLAEPDSKGYIINMYPKYLQGGAIDYARYLENTDVHDVAEGAGPRIYTVFDMERSGAGIAWDFFFPDTPRPKLIDHVEDRDLWRFNLPNTREIQANIFSHPYDFDVWDRLVETDCAELIVGGIAIERKHHKDIAELLAIVTRKLQLGGYIVPVANLPYTLVSDAAGKLAETAPFAACYWDTPTDRVFGLRSREGGVDVSEIAKIYGGGGHKHAAGFRVPLDQIAALEVRP